MYFAELPQVLIRRWYLVLLGILLSGVLAGYTFQSVSPTYQARAEILLLPPVTSVPKGGNPYLVLDGLEAIGGVLSTALTDQETTAELKADGAYGDFRVGLDQTSPAPLLEVVAEASTPRDSLATLQLVVSRIPPTMEEIQRAADVSPGSFITTTPITTTEKPAALRKVQLRAVVVVTAIGFALTLLLTAAIDGLLIRTQTRRRSAGSGPGVVVSVEASPGSDSDHRDSARSGPTTAAPSKAKASSLKARPADSSQTGGNKGPAPRGLVGRGDRKARASDGDAEIKPASH